MEMGMKEKKLIVILGALIVLAAYVFLILRPQLEIKQKLEKEINVYKTNVDNNLKSKQGSDSIDKEIKTIYNKMANLRRVYPPMINYDDLIIRMKNIAASTGVDMPAISFGNYQVFGQKVAAQKDENELKTITDKNIQELIKQMGMVENKDIKSVDPKQVTIPNGTPYILTVNFGFSGNAEQIDAFLKKIYSLNNKVTVGSYNLKIAENGTHEATVALEFLGIMDRYAGEYSMLEDGMWKPYAPSKRENPFVPYQGYASGGQNTATVAAGDNVQNSIDSYNFVMSVLPYGKGLTAPTIELSSKGGEDINVYNLKRFLNADNPGVENVEIYVEQKDGYYYCKYRTQTAAFPDQNYTNTVKLNPINDKIGLLVVSSKRNSSNDNSGVNINIINKTQKDIFVKIMNDDTKLPRVNVKAIEGTLKFQ